MTIRTSKQDCVNVADRLDTLDQIKRDILAAIASKGVPVSKLDSMLTYADKINSISGTLQLFDTTVDPIPVAVNKTLMFKPTPDPTVGAPADSLRYVTVTGAGNQSGTSWENAKRGFDAWHDCMLNVNNSGIVWAGKTILFAPGRYDLSTLYARLITSSANYKVYGGVTPTWSDRNTTITSPEYSKQTVFDFTGRAATQGLYINTASTGDVLFDGCIFKNFAMEPIQNGTCHALFNLKTSSAVPSLTLRNCEFIGVTNTSYSDTDVNKGYGIIHVDNNDAVSTNNGNGTIVLPGPALYLENCRFSGCSSAGDIVTIKSDRGHIKDCIFDNCNPGESVVGLGFSTFSLTIDNVPKVFMCTNRFTVEDTTVQACGNLTDAKKIGFNLRGGTGVFKNAVAYHMDTGFQLSGTNLLLNCAVTVCNEGIIGTVGALNYVIDRLIAYGIKNHVIKAEAPPAMVQATDESYGIVLKNSFIRDSQSILGWNSGWTTTSVHGVDDTIPFQMLNSTVSRIGSLIDWNTYLLPMQSSDILGVKFEDCTLTNITALSRNEVTSGVYDPSNVLFTRSILYNIISRGTSAVSRYVYTVKDGWYLIQSLTNITVDTASCSLLGSDPNNGNTYPAFHAPLAYGTTGWWTSISTHSDAAITALLNAYIPTEFSIIPQKPTACKLRYDVLGRPRGIINGIGAHCPILPDGIGKQLVGFALNNRMSQLEINYFMSVIMTYSNSTEDNVWGYNATTKKVTLDTTTGTIRYASSVVAPSGKIYTIPSNRSEVYLHDPTTDIGFNIGRIPNKGLFANLTLTPVLSGTTVELDVHPDKDGTTTTDATWTLTSSASWATVVAGSTTGRVTRSITTVANPTGSERRATITVAWGNLSTTMTIIQAANASAISITPTSGSSVSVSAWLNTAVYNGAVIKDISVGDVKQGLVYSPSRTTKQILKIDTLTNTLTVLTYGGTGTTHTGYYTGGVLARDGKIYFAPLDTNYVLVLDPDTDTFTEEQIVGLPTNDVLNSVGIYTDYFCGNVLTRDGTIVFVPSSGGSTVTKNHRGYTVGTQYQHNKMPGGWRAPVYHPTVNQIFAVPYNSPDILVLDMNAEFNSPNFVSTIEVGTSVNFSTPAGSSGVPTPNTINSGKWCGAAIGIDGNIYACGYADYMLVINPLSGNFKQVQAPLLWISTGGIERVMSYKLAVGNVIATQTGTLYAFPGFGGYKLIKIKPSLYDTPVLPELSTVLNPYTNRN